MPKAFKVGDKVTWVSSYTKKLGTIIVALAPMQDPLKALEPLQQQAFQYGGGQPRREESYLVHVPTASGRGQGRIYWPRTSLMNLASEE